MVIVKDKKVVVLKLKNPSRVTQVIPTAKLFEHKGQTLVAVPHKLDETRVLNNIGLKVPSPIGYYYQWSGQYTPLAHQLETAQFLTLNPHSFCLNDMGTGKTMSVLWALDYLRKIGVVKKVLIISPLSTLERVWADEIFMHFPDVTYTVVHSSSRERRMKLLNQDVDVYITNHDGVKVIEDELKGRDDINAVVIDELASFRNASTARFKSLKAVIDKKEWVWGLTGSPIPNSPTDAWAQCRLIAPDKVPKYFGRFRDMTMKQINTFKWAPREEALAVVQNCMQPAIRYKRDECIDLPDTVHTTRHVELSTEQKHMYKEMLTKLKAEYGDEKILAVNEAVKAGKLLQIACGVAYASGGEHVIIPAHERINVVKEIIEEAEGKVIVFVPFTGALERIAKELRHDYTVEVVHGETPTQQRNDIFNNFQKAKDPRVLVAHPKCMAHGLTLTAANVVVWFSPTFDGEIYEQACARITRPGQKLKTLIVHIEGSEVERRVYKRLTEKGNMQGVLLQMIKEGE